MSIVNRKTRSDKRIRVNPSLDQAYHDKLQKLALSCGYMKKTHLAQLLIESCLDSADFIESLQKKLNTNKALVVKPIVINNKLEYMTEYEN